MSLPLPPLSNIPALSNALRFLAIDAVETAGSGHPGMPIGMADVATILYARHLRFFAARPEWPARDRLILSAGHGSMLLYALNYLTGYDPVTLDELKKFRKLGALTAGHPEHHPAAGIETTTGPLGQGLATATGMAIAQKMRAAHFLNEITDHKVWVIASDGDMQEGVTHESSALAGHLKLSNLIVLYDDNHISIDGDTALSFSEDVCARYAAYGWISRRINGHDHAEIDEALAWAQKQDRPVLIACKTTIARGAGNKEGTADSHGSPLGPDAIAAARAFYHWPHAPFDIPDDLIKEWRTIGQQHAKTYHQWESSLANLPDDTRMAYLDALSGPSPKTVEKATSAAIAEMDKTRQTIATRKASQIVLDTLVPALPHMIGGSADLTGSNLTRAKGAKAITPHDFSGHYIHYGIREHGMAAIMNGISLYEGYIPFGGTFLCFADYARPSMRLAALMGIQSIYVMTHDSIGLGEDGPTHQPAEHLASLRAIPGMHVLRPADAMETAVCWEGALRYKNGPSVLALSRQNLSYIGADPADIRRGGYIVKETAGIAPRIILIATGSEVEIALSCHALLEEQGVAARVVSIPSFEYFREQDTAYKDHVLGKGTSARRVGIEAAVRQGWDEWIGPDGLFFGLNGFGASAPYKDVYAHFGLTPQAITARIIKEI